MSAPTGNSGLTPGDCLQILQQFDKWRRQGRHLIDLPNGASIDLDDLLASVRRWMQSDPHVGPMLEGAVSRVSDVRAHGRLAELQQLDLKTLGNFVRVVPPSRGTR